MASESTNATSVMEPRRGPLKVLFLSAAGLVGGAERSLYELLCALPEDRIEAHACVPAEGPLARLCALAEVRVHPVPLRRFWRTVNPFLLAGQVKALYQGAQTVRKLVEELAIDVIHANTDSAALVAWEAGRETGRPFVWHCRDLRPLGPLTQMLAGSSACAVAISAAVESHLLAQGVPPKRVRRVVNGIDLARFHGPAERPAARARARAYLGLAPETPVLLDMGAWVPWKRHEAFLEALALVRQRVPGARGILAGSDLFRQNAAYAEQLDARAEALGLDDEALLIAQEREDVPEILAACDVLVSPSHHEPFGRVLAEAGAAGVPVVAEDSGAKREIVADGVTGYLTPPGDVEALAGRCVELLSDAGLRRRLGENAIVRVAELFDVRRAALELAALFEEIAGNRSKPRHSTRRFRV